MKKIYTVSQIIAFIYSIILLFAVIIESEANGKVAWVNTTLNFAKNWWIITIPAIILALTALFRYARYEERFYKV